MNFEFIVGQKFYTKEENQQDIAKNNKYRVATTNINKFINVVLKHYCVMERHNNAHYSKQFIYYGKTLRLKISYETNVWGGSPRFEIKLKEKIKIKGKHGDYAKRCFSYYNGVINKFTSTRTTTEVLVTEFELHELENFIEIMNDANLFKQKCGFLNRKEPIDYLRSALSACNRK